MKTHEISSQYLTLDANPHQEVIFSEPSSKAVTPENPEVSIPTSSWLVSGICGVIVFAIFIFAWRQTFGWRRKEEYANDWDFHQHIPCYNCRFSSRNPYLKCAVHPTKAMKKDAMDCLDYWAKDSDRFSR